MSEKNSPLGIGITCGAGAVIFMVRVQPRASRDEVAGAMGGAMKVRLRAPALENRANDALVELLAVLLGTPRSAVRILRGHRNRTKRIEVRGVTEQQVLSLLGSASKDSTNEP
jgi:uncharacterized protein